MYYTYMKNSATIVLRDDVKHSIKKQFVLLITDLIDGLDQNSKFASSFSGAYFIDTEIKAKLTIVKDIRPKPTAYYSFCWYLSEFPSLDSLQEDDSGAIIKQYLHNTMRCTLYLYHKNNTNKSYQELHGIDQLAESISCFVQT